MKKPQIILLVIFSLISCSTPQDVFEINEICDNIYVKHNKSNEFTRIYHVKSLAAVGGPGRIMAMAIGNITGIQSLYPSPYEFMVTISPIYNWDDIEPTIIKRIQEFIEIFDQEAARQEKEKYEKPKQSL